MYGVLYSVPYLLTYNSLLTRVARNKALLLFFSCGSYGRFGSL